MHRLVDRIAGCPLVPRTPVCRAEREERTCPVEGKGRDKQHVIEHFLDAGDGGSGVPARGKGQATAASGAREPRGARERLSPAFVIDEQALCLRELAEHEQRLDGVGHETHHARLTDAGSVKLGSQRQELPDGPAGVPLRKLEEAERGR